MLGPEAEVNCFTIRPRTITGRDYAADHGRPHCNVITPLPREYQITDIQHIFRNFIQSLN
jgi:hypothetical protein